MATLRVPDNVPSPTQDCETLRRAFQGLGTDEKAIIKVLCHRNAAQRKLISETFQRLYNVSLIDQLHSELSGDFRKAVILWIYDPPERDARLAHEALKSRRKDVNELQIIVEIACASSPHHLVAVRQAYCALYDCSLEEDIISSVPMPIQKILVCLVSTFRCDKNIVNSATAELEAARLHEVIKAKKLDDDDFMCILGYRNFSQLRETFLCYTRSFGISVDEDIMNCGKGTLENLLKVAIWCIDCPEKHFAEVIRASIAGLGTDEDSLSRAIICRAEIDLMKVRGEYFNMNKTSLDNAVKGDTSGDYRNFLMSLLGANV